MSEKATYADMDDQDRLELVVMPYTTFYSSGCGYRLAMDESGSSYYSSYMSRLLKLPFFFYPGIGLVEVKEEPLFGGWRCSPVPKAELAKELRKGVQFRELSDCPSQWTLCDVDLYDHFAEVMAGTRTSNPYFPELKGLVFVGHKTSDGKVLKRRGFNKRSGLFVMGKQPFFAANDESMAVAA